MGKFSSIQLKVVTPSKVFLELDGVQHIMIDTIEGSYGILPNRLDFVAILEPGIMLFEESSGETSYIAHNIGLVVKKGNEVTISTHDAMQEAELGKIKESLHEEVLRLEESEAHIRQVIADIERDITSHILSV